jgi:hypothetical protein
MAFFTFDEKGMALLAFFGGLINPIAIVYIVLRILRRTIKVRTGLAIAILLFIPLTWHRWSA